MPTPTIYRDTTEEKELWKENFIGCGKLREVLTVKTLNVVEEEKQSVRDILFFGI